MEQKIFEAFLYNKKLKFNEIEKLLKTRSNKLAYHIKALEKKGIIFKENKCYQLSETAESLIPYISNKKAVMTILLIALTKQKKIFLYKREKRPFKNKFSLPGGRLITGESLAQGTKRIMKKFNINATLKKINSVSLEHVNKKYSFLLIFITASTKDKIIYTDPKKNKNKIISSDYKLITNDLDKEIKIKTLNTKD